MHFFQTQTDTHTRPDTGQRKRTRREEKKKRRIRGEEGKGCEGCKLCLLSSPGMGALFILWQMPGLPSLTSTPLPHAACYLSRAPKVYTGTPISLCKKASAGTNGKVRNVAVHGNRSHPFSSVARNRLANMTSHRSYIGEGQEKKGNELGLEALPMHYTRIYSMQGCLLGEQIVSDTLQMQPRQKCH